MFGCYAVRKRSLIGNNELMRKQISRSFRCVETMLHVNNLNNCSKVLMSKDEGFGHQDGHA